MSMFVEEIAPDDESRHLADDDPAYNESSYYNFACASSGIVGWLRIAVQSNRRVGQATALVFLPTGETLFAFERVEDPGDEELAVGPIAFQIIEPHVAQRLSFDGRVSLLTDGRVLANPGPALRSAPTEQTSMRLAVTGLGAPFGTRGNSDANVVEETMALGHYEQFVHVSGDLEVGARSYRIDGRGLRDHSWGPRDWAGPLAYRWVTAAMDDGSVIMALDLERRDGGRTRRAAVFRDGVTAAAQLTDLSLHRTDDGFCHEIRCELASTAGESLLVATALRPEQFVPLRHRRGDGAGGEKVTRIGYAPYRFRAADGSRGIGPIEVLDQMIDGRPAGMAGAGGAGAGRS